MFGGNVAYGKADVGDPLIADWPVRVDGLADWMRKLE